MANSILYLSYWSLSEGLTAATVLPSLLQLQGLDTIARVYLVTMERELEAVGKLALPSKVVHIPLTVQNRFPLHRYIQEFITLPQHLQQLVANEKIDFILARGATAGTMALAVAGKSNTPFYVESFEPHADYMVDSGVWSRRGLKYLFQHRQEQKQKRFAAGLMPVAKAYTNQLLAEGVPAAKIKTVPCVVNCKAFAFDKHDRKQVRQLLGIPATATVGVYLGKYGGLYYKGEAFEIYRKCFARIPDFFLLILTPEPAATVLEQLHRFAIPDNKVHAAAVPHQEVRNYLAASDFAFATYKPGPSKKYVSPVKIGEYWASGLPVLLTKGIGDESDIIRREGGGALFNLAQEGSLEQALEQIQGILQDPNHRQQILKLAMKYRSPDALREAYAYFFGGGGAA